MATKKIAVFLCLDLGLQFGDYVCGLSTDPPTVNGGTAVVAALENATNVSVFCAVTIGGMPSLTLWSITVEGGTIQRIFGIPGVPNFFSTGSGRENLTIISFNRNFDMALLECDNNFDNARERAFFSLRIIG